MVNGTLPAYGILLWNSDGTFARLLNIIMKGKNNVFLKDFAGTLARLLNTIMKGQRDFARLQLRF